MAKLGPTAEKQEAFALLRETFLEDRVSRQMLFFRPIDYRRHLKDNLLKVYSAEHYHGRSLTNLASSQVAQMSVQGLVRRLSKGRYEIVVADVDKARQTGPAKVVCDDSPERPRPHRPKNIVVDDVIDEQEIAAGESSALDYVETGRAIIDAFNAEVRKRVEAESRIERDNGVNKTMLRDLRGRYEQLKKEHEALQERCSNLENTIQRMKAAAPSVGGSFPFADVRRFKKDQR